MKAKRYNLQKRKVTAPINAIITSKTTSDNKTINSVPATKTRKKRFGIFTKSEE